MQFDLLGKAVRRFRLPAADYIGAPVIIIPVQEGDVNSRYFEITMYDDRGDMDLSIYNKAILSGSTPSGVVLTSTKCEISDDKKSVIVQFGGGFTARTGRVACDIMFTNSDATVCLTTQTFYVIVSESQSGKIITENDDDYNELLTLLKEVSSLESRIQEAENSRVEAETARSGAESKRAEAESIRKQSEDTRVAQEKIRQDNEAERITNENARKDSESNRATAEDARVLAEASRVSAETSRAQAETDRSTAEQTRQSNETNRETTEAQRVSAETARVAAETKREEDFQAAKEDCESATNDANSAARDVRDLLDALPCPTNKIDGEVTTPFIALNFVALED